MNPKTDPQFVLVLTQEQAQIVNLALDFYSRMGMGQIEILAEKIQGWTWQDKRSEQLGYFATIRTSINTIKSALGHPPNGSYGIFNTVVPGECRAAFDIAQVLRYVMYNGTRNPQPIMISNSDVPPAKCYSIQAVLKGKESLDTFINVVAILIKVDEDSNGTS